MHVLHVSGNLLPKLNLYLKTLLSILSVLVSCLTVVTQVSAQKTGSAHTVLTGTVTKASDGTALGAATVKLKGSTTGILTNKAGEFTLTTSKLRGVFSVSYIGYTSQEIPFDSASTSPFSITLSANENSLDEIQVIGYGQVSKRFNTGSVVTVKAEDIERQPVSNPLAALAGRVPGMTVTQSSGNPGAKVNIQIRGQNSISQGSQPLFIIDGVPFPNDNMGTGEVFTINGGQSPFENINPNDIEQIDVLKDADATAIYGSRGANGVVLITTKRGNAGTTKLDASVYSGAGQITDRLDLLNTQQYVAMRKEAFANDGIEPTALNAPDIMLWDTTRYTDWQEKFIGGTAHFTNASASLSGGNTNTQFLISGNYNRQTTVYPGDFAQSRGGGLVNISHKSSDNRLMATASATYSINHNLLPSSMVSHINIPPNTPTLVDEEGNLVWSENGATFTNPFDALYQSSNAETGNLITNLGLEYRIFKGLTGRLSGGYNQILVNDSRFIPISSLNPDGNNNESTSYFSNATNNSWILEPRLDYATDLGKGSLNLLMGATIQRNTSHLYDIEASGFPNDALLGASEFASSVTTSTSKIEYRYQAAFGRINYNYNSKYLINLTARRDGSSRFGPDKRVANFGALGAAWIFGEEHLIKHNLLWLSFGKLRGSYGITGNDQIGDYQYLDNYGGTQTQYHGQIGYIPSRLYNASYSWEQSRKMELGLELGAFGNKIMLNANWFRNRSDNQLINYKLPNQTGFSSILRNFGALVENQGFEIDLSSTVISNKQISWSVAGNFTRNRNKLLKFDGLESSSYSNSLVIGYPLGIAKYLHWTGVDPNTGLHTFEGTEIPTDQNQIVDLTPEFYGSVSSNLTFKDWDFAFLFQYTKQLGVSYVTGFGGYAPGMRYNQPVRVLERWRQQGDHTETQRFTTGGDANSAFTNYARYSDGRVTDASYIRLKSVHLSYTIPQSITKQYDIATLKLFFQGQNLFTFTDFEGLDPESGPFNLPPMRIYSVGIQISL
ncbi:SusC/RagA family TonB-linked outer membrane protein [Sphingobacterium spiritivorum]|uniref:SusC/RagA family TonB-linked outer membrane protein n=1 Tax=Sphingobacterium spiritivorum TaxID=258 RepID=UPI003DA672F3